MQPNLKFSKDGVQISVFPSVAVLITQNPGGSFSHAGTKSTDQAYTPNTKLYAPVDLICVKNNGATPGGATYYHTKEKVHTPYGLIHYSLVLTHDNNGGSWEVGKTYPQGSHIYTEGTAGYVTGRHVHIDVALGHVTNQYQLPNGNWEIPNSMYLDQIMFVNHTTIIQGNASPNENYLFNWKTFDGGTIDPGDPGEEPEKVVGDIETLMMVKALPDFF